jgi:hypothetical protein
MTVSGASKSHTNMDSPSGFPHRESKPLENRRLFSFCQFVVGLVL